MSEQVGCLVIEERRAHDCSGVCARCGTPWTRSTKSVENAARARWSRCAACRRPYGGFSLRRVEVLAAIAASEVCRGHGATLAEVRGVRDGAADTAWLLSHLRAARFVQRAPGKRWILTWFGRQLVAELLGLERAA